MKPGPSRLHLSFRPPWWAMLLAASGCAAGLALGNWQSDRAEQKRAAATAVKRVSMTGEFLPKFTILLDNKVQAGRPGYHVIQPLRLAEGGRHVLVNRGWVAATARRDLLPQIHTPLGMVALEGVRLDRFARAYEPPGTFAFAPVRQNITTQEFAAWSGLALEPWVIEQHSALDDGLVRDWPPPDLGIEKHEMYALQWYSLAALSVGLLLVLNIKRDGHASG